LTTRERVALQTKGANCQTCHTVINGLGFALEGFDAIGKLRTQDNKKPIDASGTYLNREGKTLNFAGAADLAKYLADSPDAKAAFAEQMWHHLVQQPVRAFGEGAREAMLKGFEASGWNAKQLAVEIAIAGSGRGRNK